MTANGKRQKNKQNSKNWILTHLERLAKLVTHDVVQDGIDACRYKVENSRDVGDNHECRTYCFIVILISAIDRKKSLGVKWGPAEEERYHHGHWKREEQSRE